MASRAARARVRAPAIVSASPKGWSGTPLAAATASISADGATRASTARTAAPFTGLRDPTATRPSDDNVEDGADDGARDGTVI